MSAEEANVIFLPQLEEYPKRIWYSLIDGHVHFPPFADESGMADAEYVRGDLYKAAIEAVKHADQIARDLGWHPIYAVTGEVLRHHNWGTTMNRIEQAITTHWGERCEDFCPGCPICDAWAEYDALLARGPDTLVHDAVIACRIIDEAEKSGIPDDMPDAVKHARTFLGSLPLEGS